MWHARARARARVRARVCVCVCVCVCVSEHSCAVVIEFPQTLCHIDSLTTSHWCSNNNSRSYFCVHFPLVLDSLAPLTYELILFCRFFFCLTLLVY